MVRVYRVISNRGQSSAGLKLWPTAAFHPGPEYWMVFTLPAPIPLDAACHTVLAPCAAAGPTVATVRASAIMATRLFVIKHLTSVTSITVITIPLRHLRRAC